MIVDSLYPDSGTIGNSGKITDTISNINITDIDTDPCSAYYMGCIPADKIKTWATKIFKFDADSGKVVCTSDNSFNGSGLNWFWSVGTGGQSDTDIKWITNKYVSNLKLINSILAHKINYFGRFNFRFDLYDFSLSQTLSSGRTVYYQTSGSAIYSTSKLCEPTDIIDFFVNGNDWSITYNGDTYNFTFAAFDKTARCWDLGNGLKLFIRDVVTDSESYSTATYSETGLNTWFKIHSNIMANTDYGFYAHRDACYFVEGDLRIRYPYAMDDIRYSPWVLPNNTLISDDVGCLTGLADFEVYMDELYYAIQNPNWIILNSNYVRIKKSGEVSNPWWGYENSIKLGVDLSEWWLIYCLNAKTAEVRGLDNQEYIATTWTSIFDSKNVPTGTKSNATPYTALFPNLRNWQQYGLDITVDDYDPSESSPTVRPDPTPFPDGENVGDDIYLPDSLGIGGTLGFITQFAMTAAQIGELGQQLWTSFLDPDYWKNYMFRFVLDTGSFNMSDLLNYFISLRVYPFSMSNIPSLANYGQDMFIGAGIVPLHYSTNLYTINTLCEYLDAGSLQMPFVFGDFRDCTNMEIILYLPYCGTVQLEPADVLGGKLTARYAIDFGSGACTAYVEIDTWDEKHYLLAALPGQIGSDVPMSATVAGQVAARIGSDVLNMAGTIGSGTADIATSSAALIAGVVTSNPMLAVGGAGKLIGAEASTVGGVAGQLAGMAQRPGIAAPMLSAGRGFSSHGSPRKCYVQIRSPQYQIPDNYKQTAGTPAAKQVTVSSCSGLCRFVNPVISGVHGTEEEKNKIRQLLQAGIIV